MRKATSLSGTLIRIVIVAAVFFMGVGCVDEFVADVDAPSPRPLVVDGGITSGPGPHSVTLSLAAAFEQSLEGATDRVEGADVAIVDRDTETRVQLQETTRGRYETEEGELTGVPGHEYRLEITLPDGRMYRSQPERMPEPVSLDSTSAVYDASPAQRIKVLAAFDDPEDEKNYYRWSVRVTRQYPIKSNTPPFVCWARVGAADNQFPLLDDRLVSGAAISNQVVYAVPPGPSASRMNQVDVRQLAITEEAYDFWSRVEEQVEDTDDPFSAPPGPIRGNVVAVQDTVERALGYFEVAGASRRTTTCFRQSDFEDAPVPSPPEGRCPGGGVAEEPDYWACSPARGE